MNETTEGELVNEPVGEPEPGPVPTPDAGPDPGSEALPEPEPEPEPDTAPQPVIAGVRPTVMLLAGGELSRELVVAFQRLGALVVAVAAQPDAPALQAADRSAVAAVEDAAALTALVEAENPDYVVADSAGVAPDALIEVAERGLVEVFPTPRGVRLGRDREGLRRLASDELGLPTAPFWFAGSAEELGAVAEHAGYPLVVKPVAGAAAEGQSVLLRPADVEPAWQRAVATGTSVPQRVIAETVVEVDYQITLLTIRTTGPAGPMVAFCEPIGHREADGRVLEAWQPHQMAPQALDAAKSIAARIVNSLGGRGVFAVELLVRDDEVYFSDVRARPQDSGLVTLRSQRLSQFELHARAILGLAVDTIMISPAAVEITYGGPAAGLRTPSAADFTAILAEALATQESDLRLFGGPEAGDDRHRLGAALATAPDTIIARDRARRTGAALRRLW